MWNNQLKLSIDLQPVRPFGKLFAASMMTRINYSNTLVRSVCFVVFRSEIQENVGKSYKNGTFEHPPNFSSYEPCTLLNLPRQDKKLVV